MLNQFLHVIIIIIWEKTVGQSPPANVIIIIKLKNHPINKQKTLIQYVALDKCQIRESRHTYSQGETWKFNLLKTEQPYWIKHIKQKVTKRSAMI
jgi:hypothetical protein